jgi:phospholipid/cholesterol/gamma-HCH transport system substrate-binding protein
VHAEVKTFSERNPVIIGAVGAAIVAVLVTAALQYQKLPFLNQTKEYSAYFADAGGLFTGAGVEVSGYPVGKVSSIALDGARVLVEFTVADDIHLGQRTEAAIKTKSLLGTKVLNVTPDGPGQLDGTIPLERTVSPYQLPDALGDLANTISGLNTNQLSDSLSTLAQTFADTPPHLKSAVEGVARFAQTINSHDEQLRTLLSNAAKVTAVLAKRSDQVVRLVEDTNALLAQLRTQSDALDHIWANISAVTQQLKAFIGENRQQLKPALDKLNGVLTIVDNRKDRLAQAVKLLNSYAMSLGESVSSGPFFKAYVVNLLPGQFVQPFVDAAFSDLGLDPNVKVPSQLTDPQTGQPGTPPLPVPLPRTGQGGEPALHLPDAITGNPGDQGCGPAGVALPGPTGCYPYREPLPAPPPGGPPPGPPADSPPGIASVPEPTPSPVYVPAPGEAPAPAPTGGQP